MKALRRFWICAVLLCAGSALAAPLNQEQINAARQIASGFDADRWHRIVEELTDNHGLKSRFCLRVRGAEIVDGSDPPDDAADRAADWIMEQLRAYGYEPTEHPFKYTLYSMFASEVGNFTMRNIAAEKRGSGHNARRVILLTAHYDSVVASPRGRNSNWRESPAPGAIDNATGVAAVLEAARLFAEVEYDLTVRFVLFSGEEMGLSGSRNYARDAQRSGDSIAGVLNVDMIGFDAEGPFDLHIAADRNSEWLLQTAHEAANDPQFNLALTLHRGNGGFDFGDHTPFWYEGFSAVAFTQDVCPFFYPHYHTVEDTIDKVQIDYASEAVPAYIAAAAAAARPLINGEPPAQEPGRLIDVSVYPNPFRLNGSRPLTVHCQLDEPARIALRLYDSAGRVLYETSADGQIGLNRLIEWDGRTMNGEFAAPGVYFINVTTELADGAVSRRTARLLIFPSREPW